VFSVFTGLFDVVQGFGALLSVGVAGGGVIYALENSINAGEVQLHPSKIPWSHSGWFNSFDYKSYAFPIFSSFNVLCFSVRRGYEVYKQVCAACHSMRFICYRHFVNVFMTEEEAKAEAAEVTRLRAML
jgi:ubiquinol-cytochrome c reductase cytochrome c1 subunit